jgi:hypothetical protein
MRGAEVREARLHLVAKGIGHGHQPAVAGVQGLVGRARTPAAATDQREFQRAAGCAVGEAFHRQSPEQGASGHDFRGRTKEGSAGDTRGFRGNDVLAH